MEKRMLLHACRDVEIAGRSAQRSGIPLARNPQPGSVLRTGWNIHRNRFCSCDAPVPMASWTGILQFSFAAAAWAREIEFHGAGHLRNRSSTIALGAGDGIA